MSTDWHTPIPYGADADDTVFNAPLGELDQAIFDLIEGDIPLDAFRVGSAALDASAIGQISSTTQGLVIPRMTSAQRNAIASPAEGLLIYNTDDNAPNFYDGGWFNLYPFGDSSEQIIPLTSVASAASITISAIPQTFQDLLLRFRLKTGGSGGILRLRFNNESGLSDYAWAIATNNFGGTFLGANDDQADSEIEIPIPTGTDAGRFADIAVYIRNYAAAQKIYGDYEGIGWNSGASYLWGAFEFTKGDAIDEINILPGPSASNFTGSYSLFGIGSA